MLISARMTGRANAFLAGVLTLVAVTASGCLLAHAKTVPSSPPLDMPAPPPRVIETSDTAAPLPPVPLVEEPVRQPVRPQSRPTPRSESTRPEAPKADQPKAEQGEGLKPEEKPAQTTLQTTPAAAEGELERTIRAQLNRATADLNRIDYRALNADARNQYETAKRFIRQSDEALRQKNLVFAKNLADKAASLAGQLAGR